MARTWKTWIAADPHYSPNLSRTSLDFAPDLSKPDGLFCAYARTASDQVTPRLSHGHVIGQEFVADHDDLCGIAVKLATYGQTVPGGVALRLRESRSSSSDLAVADADVRPIRDNEYHLFMFPPVRDSAQRKLYFCLEAVHAGADDRVAAWTSRDIDETMGPYIAGEVTGRGTLAFKLFTRLAAVRT